jgi:hypothetical protein
VILASRAALPLGHDDCLFDTVEIIRQDAQAGEPRCRLGQALAVGRKGPNVASPQHGDRGVDIAVGAFELGILPGAGQEEIAGSRAATPIRVPGWSTSPTERIGESSSTM